MSKRKRKQKEKKGLARPTRMPRVKPKETEKEEIPPERAQLLAEIYEQKKAKAQEKRERRAARKAALASKQRQTDAGDRSEGTGS